MKEEIKMSESKVLFAMFVLLFCWETKTISAEELNQQQCFEYVFGEQVKLDTGMVRKVGADLSGKRYYVDRNGDGKPEEVWYVDIDPRHTKAKRPILVRAIDRDGDLTAGGEPDYDSDLYVVDYNADGKVDAVVSYEDLDGDGDVDRMGIFHFDAHDGIRVWWSRDDGDDNLLWYTVDYSYYQRLCEDKNHFGGDETFDLLHIKPGEKEWTPFSENPFSFFDCDGDGITEEVIRIVGEGQSVRSIRWSFDATNAGTKENPRNYDVSLTAMMGNGRVDVDNEEIAEAPLSYGNEMCERILIEGFPARIMKRNKIKTFLSRQVWTREIMTWGEDGLNIAYHVDGYTIPRWEGVIASASTEKGYEMPRIGWPDCGPVNKRYEIIMHPQTSPTYYYSAADRRIHLKGSDKSWMKVDFDYDAKVDINYEWIDTDKDSLVDKVLIDVNGDGKWDDSYRMLREGCKDVTWTFADVNGAFGAVVAEEPEKMYTLNLLLTSALESQGEKNEDAVWRQLENKLECGGLTKDLSNRLVKNDESVLYFLRLAADRRIVELKKKYLNKSFWKTFEDSRSHGNLEAMTLLVERQFHLHVGDANRSYADWLERLREPEKTKRVAWNNNWWAPNWGWESEKAAFRAYDGHFDLFGKRYDYLVLPTLTKDIHYHNDEGGWGMDILHVGATGGCGGIVVYVNGKAYPTRHEKDGDPVWVPRLIQESEDSVTLGFTVTGIGPDKEHPYTLKMTCTARAGHFEDMRNVCVEGGLPGDEIKLGIVISKIPVEDFFIDKESGVMGLWGFQDPLMGWIGMGVMFPAERYLGQDDNANEYCALFRLHQGEWLRFYAQGDWLRGHRFLPGGGAKDWQNTLLKEKSVGKLR